MRMERFIALLGLAAVCTVQVISQPMRTTQLWQPPSHWDPALDIDKYPNPMNEPTKCKQSSSEFWLCDPNYTLTNRQMQFIIDHIRRIQEGTKHKLLVGVALVNGLKLLSQEEVGNKTDYCGAYILNTTWSGFKSSCSVACAGYVYVFLSWNDYEDFVSTNIQDNLVKDCKKEFSDVPKLLNASNVNSNFEYINATFTVLGKYAEGHCDNEPLAISKSALIISVVVIIIIVVAAIVGIFMWRKMRNKEEINSWKKSTAASTGGQERGLPAVPPASPEGEGEYDVIDEHPPSQDTYDVIPYTRVCQATD